MTTASSTQTVPGFSQFAIGFDHRDRARLHSLLDEVLDSERWSEGAMVYQVGLRAGDRPETRGLLLAIAGVVTLVPTRGP